MNNRIKLDTTMLQSNTAMHLMAFMLTQRDLVLELLSIIKQHQDVMDSAVRQCIDQELGNTVSWSPVRDIEDMNDIKRMMKEVTEDFEYIIKLHAHAIHQRSGTKIYKKERCRECDGQIDRWATNNKSAYDVD